MSCVLEMEDISKRFPGVQALDRVSLAVERGEIRGLVGENGAGKSTLMKILSGAYSSDSGKIFLEGRAIDHLTPHRMIEQGVAVIYQELMLAGHLTVAENVFMGRLPSNRLGMVDHARMARETAAICASLGLDLDPSALVQDLSIAKRQMVEIAKALSRKARIIVLDEPTAVLGEQELRGMFQLVRNLAAAGVAIIYISHRLKEVFELVHNVTVMKDGRVVCTQPVAELTIDQLVKHMVGRDLTDIYPPKRRAFGPEVLKVEGLGRGSALRDISFSLREGEILAIAGLAGAGRSEVLRAIIGADPVDQGEIWVLGRSVRGWPTRGIIACGVGLLPEDRKGEGLFLKQSVAFNTTIARHDDLCRMHILSLRRERLKVQEYIRRIRIRPDDPDRVLQNLSGGNQQKVVFARWLNARCRILLVDEPTRGVDVGAKQEIYGLLTELVHQGLAVLMVSSELPEVLGLSDRILVMHQGRMVAELAADATTEEEIMRHATGQLAS
jgi:ribose transport system ATP-binding protein